MDDFSDQAHDWACKGRSAEMAAWEHLVPEEGHDDKPGMGRATGAAGHEVQLWHVWRWGYHWGFPRALLRISSWSSAFNGVWD